MIRILADFYVRESQRQEQKWKLSVQEQVYISLVEVAAKKKMTIPELIENLIEKQK
jgi:predicted DNA-binding ribbon-helix-helix protein